jgi:transcriptional regulator with GAF, ATPase, and Fis domain
MDSDRLQHLALAVSNERSLDEALNRVVTGLASEEEIALARIWLIQPGDICSTCSMREECPDQTTCLHLVASSGESIRNAELRWTYLDGDYRRFPLGVRKVGRIGATGEPAMLQISDASTEWLRDPDWAQEEGIRGFTGQPLLFRGEILGVIALFSRVPLVTLDSAALRWFADQASSSIANARAFEEIERLKYQLEQENTYLKEEAAAGSSMGDIVGESQPLTKMLQQVDLVASTNASVLIHGETGTGKEMVAHRIHAQSQRSNGPFIKVNCASIPRELFESEFFGHVKGAFTGATSDRAGRFELADGGTLFLDEVAEIPLDLQAKLLRTLQEGSFEPVGGERSRRTDARIVAATNRDLQQACTDGVFRQDLYYRLSVFPIDVPSLRTRPEDIPALARTFLKGTCRRMGLQPPDLKQNHIDQLCSYDWPGNIRELQNVIERGVIVSPAGALHFDLQSDSLETTEHDDEGRAIPVAAATAAASYTELRDVEKKMILAALAESEGKVAGKGGAAERLGIPPSTLTSKLMALGIRKDRHAWYVVDKQQS